MQLRSNNITPYGRKVLLTLKLLNMADSVEIIHTIPYDDANLRNNNPLGRIPVLHDGTQTIFDSFVIMQYLEQKAGANILLKATNSIDLWQNYALAEGILQAGLNYRQNTMRHEKDNITPLDDWYMQRQLDSIIKGIAKLDERCALLPQQLRLDTISTICVLDWLDFRMPHLAWQQQYSALANWQDTMHKHPIIEQTMPR